MIGDKVVEMVIDSTRGVERVVFIYDDTGAPYGIRYYEGYNDTVPAQYTFMLNLQGDVVRILDCENCIVANYVYDAWGNILAITDADGEEITYDGHIANLNPIRYRGYMYDTETGLYYCNSRYYDPQVGRFINADSFTSTGQGFGGFNMFAYCQNNPVMLVDPSGCIVTDWDLEHLNSQELEILYRYTEQWHMATTKEEKIEAEMVGQLIRNPHLEKNEMLLPNGIVVDVDTDTHEVNKYFSNIDQYISYTVTPTVIHVDTKQEGFLVLYNSNQLNLLAKSMLDTYKSIYGMDFHGRTESGLESEMYCHAWSYINLNGKGWLQWFADKGEIASLESSKYRGFQNYHFFGA